MPEVAEVVAAVRDEAKRREHSGKANPTQTVGEGSRHSRETDAVRAKMAGTNRQYIHLADKLAKEARVNPESYTLTTPRVLYDVLTRSE